jgi:hypothetical protein
MKGEFRVQLLLHGMQIQSDYDHYNVRSNH